MLTRALLAVAVVSPWQQIAVADDAATEQVTKVYSQTATIEKSIEQGSTVEQIDRQLTAGNISEAQFHAGPVPQWIWGSDDNADYWVRTTFTAANVSAATLKASCDNVGQIFLNGEQVAESGQWQEAMSANVLENLQEGDNLLEAKIQNQGGAAGFVFKLAMIQEDDTVRHVVTDQSWTIDSQREGSFESKVSVRAKLGDAPWGNVLAQTRHAGRIPRDVFELLPGFQAEKLFTVPNDVLGSWVCITFDPQGRLLASDQGDKGLCRITLPDVGATGGETIVERLDFSKCNIQPSAAQGMLFAFDSLYLSINGGPGSGLYRARDTDNDDQFDECVLLKKLNGGGEHGPHALRLSPDGKRIFLIAGNHTDPPFRAGDDLENEAFSSRIPTNWGEDLLLPRMWDPNGHARGRMAPGGWIASTDPDGKSWDIWSIGYRNPYDMAFNADGELFAYDADMEWDVGSPWYRPTRVVHATSGSEFGWRSGSGKWPTYYHDSLPPLVDIGPGSPVGVDFGYGLKFPARYQKALYICDWTFGTMYAIHTTPNGSSYTAEKEEFVSRTPLPLTDVAAGPDGALYFTIGGRGSQSELYRVTYNGNESTAPTELHDEAFANDRELRHMAESFYASDLSTEAMTQVVRDAQSDGLPIERFNARGSDRALNTALRRLSQKRPTAEFQIRTLQNASVKDSEALELLTGLIRGVGRNGQDAMRLRQSVIDLLMDTSLEQHDVDHQLKFLRTLSLCWIRLGAPTEEEREYFVSALDPSFPSSNSRINRELCQVLIYLKSPTVVEKTIGLLQQPPQHDDIDMGELLTRNAGYGQAINNMIANQPDKNQIWYAFCLRVAEVGWTTELRKDYFRWFSTARQWGGGHSFGKFLQNIDDELWNKTSENDRILIEAAGGRIPYKAPELPVPEGPGKEWTLDEVRQLATDGLNERSFANGEKMFAATRCIVCHRFAGRGAATGPDLTQLAGRFNVKDLTEAIIDPSKVISDQYKASSVLRLDGKATTGRIVSDTQSHISILADPEDSTKVIDIPKADIDEIVPSSTSLMPKGLLSKLNQTEVLDLLAYLLSRGNRNDAMFKQE